MTTIISGLYELLTSENKENSSIDLKGVEEALHDIAVSISGVADSIDKLSDAVIATVKDEHELRHYGHLKTAVRSLVASRADSIVLNDAKRELDAARKYCVSGVYWIALAEYENLLGCVTIGTLRKAFAYSKSDNHFEQMQKVLIYFYLFKLSLQFSENSIVQDIFHSIITELDNFNLSDQSRNAFAKSFVFAGFISESNYDLLKTFTQKPYVQAIDDSIECLKEIKVLPAKIENINLPILSVSKPVIYEDNILIAGENIIDKIKALEVLVEENNKYSTSLGEFLFKDFYGLFLVSFILIISGFIYFPLFSLGAILFLAVFIGSLRNFFMRIVFPRKKTKLEEEQKEIQRKWENMIKKIISISECKNA